MECKIDLYNDDCIKIMAQMIEDNMQIDAIIAGDSL